MRYLPLLFIFFSCSTQKFIHSQEHLKKEQTFIMDFKVWEKKQEPIPLSCSTLYLQGREQLVVLIQDQATLIKELLDLSTAKDSQWAAVHK